MSFSEVPIQTNTSKLYLKMLGERDLKSKLFFVTVLVLQLLIVQGQESCTDAKSYFYGVLDLDSSLLSVRPTERAGMFLHIPIFLYCI